MLEKHPNRKKDKYNPYTLTITEGHYYLSFKDGRGKQQNIEIDEMLYQTFDRFELEDISHLNRVSRHIEHSDIMDRTIKRGDIFYAELNPVIGSEQGGTRPVLIISNDIGNSHSPTVIIAAITGRTQTKAKLPTHTEVKDVEGLDRDSIILLEQIRTIDKQRLKNHMGTMPNNIMARVDKALAISFAMTKK